MQKIVLGEARVSYAIEMSRLTQDRVALLENDHSRLIGQVDSRFAAGQEFEDYMLNKAEEDWIEITGERLLKLIVQAVSNCINCVSKF